MTTLVSDTFTDTNGTALASHTPDIDVEGGGWSEDGSGIEIQSNRAAGDSGSLTTIGYIETEESDVTIDLVMQVGNAVARIGAAARYSDSNNYWIIRIKADADRFSIYEVNGGGWTERAGTSFTDSLSTDYDLHVDLDGQDIVATIDGGDEISYASASHNQTETMHGIYTYTTDTQIDDFIIQTEGGVALLERRPGRGVMRGVCRGG